MLRGVIFDLDNTLVDSQLDFEAMRREMRLQSDLRILEAIAELPAEHAAECHFILRRHEQIGAEQATLLPGVAQLLAKLQEQNLPVGIVTRNSRENSLISLKNTGLEPHILITRDDGPIKPDPWAVKHICQQWQVPPHEVVMIGDYRFDVDSGRDAGAKTVILTGEVHPDEYPNEEGADLRLRSLAETDSLWAWLMTL